MKEFKEIINLTNLELENYKIEVLKSSKKDIKLFIYDLIDNQYDYFDEDTLIDNDEESSLKYLEMIELHNSIYII